VSEPSDPLSALPGPDGTGPDGARGRRRRPRLVGGRPHGVMVAFSAEELAVLRAAATREGLSVGAFVAAAAAAVARGADPAGAGALGGGGVLVASAGPGAQLLAAVLDAQRQVARYGQLVNQAVTRLHATGEAGPQLEAALSACTRATSALEELAWAGAARL